MLKYLTPAPPAKKPKRVSAAKLKAQAQVNADNTMGFYEPAPLNPVKKKKTDKPGPDLTDPANHPIVRRVAQTFENDESVFSPEERAELERGRAQRDRRLAEERLEKQQAIVNAAAPADYDAA